MNNSSDHQKYILSTSRLRLREMAKDDLDFVAKMLACPEVIRYYPQVYNREEAAAACKEYAFNQLHTELRRELQSR